MTTGFTNATGDCKRECLYAEASGYCYSHSSKYTKDKEVKEVRKCIFRKKLHDKKFNKDYFRCTRDGSIRKDKSCYKCYNYVPSLWQKFKNWFDRHFY